METKAKYVLVGFCSLLLIALAFGMLMFTIKRGDSKQLAYYAIDFSGSVSGLSIGNDVRFNGIRVGEVRDFTINANDPSQVRVFISVHVSTPIRQDSEASLTMQGITGLAVVDISGGSATSPKLPRGNEDDMPLIKSRRSPLVNAIEEVPSLMYQANELLSRGTNVLSPENQESISNILNSLELVSQALERQSKNMETAFTNIAQASSRLDKVLGTDIEEGIASFKSASKRLDDLLKKIEPGTLRLADGVADELFRTLAEAQVLLRNMNSLIDTINSDPQRFFFGDTVPGMRIK